MENIAEIASTMRYLIEETGSTTENIKTGLTELDNITAGCRKSELILIAGERKMGKTAFIISLLRNMAYERKVNMLENRLSVAYFSVQKSKFLVMSYLLSNICSVEVQQLRDGKLMPSQKMDIEETLSKIEITSFYIDDRSELSIADLKSSLKEFCNEEGKLDALFIDGLNLMNHDGELCLHNEKALGLTMLGLKSLAKEYEIPVFVTYEQKKTTSTVKYEDRHFLYDIYKENKFLMVADMIWILYRPEYYHIVEDEDGNSLLGIAEVIVSKNTGKTGTAKVAFKHNYFRFEDVKQQQPDSEPVFGKFD